jgi:drug/metabolite transporter (DMT)-like permease
MVSITRAVAAIPAAEALAFGAIYVLWGATFLAIRIAVLEIPPFFTAGLRFFVAGSLLYGFMRARGQPRPSPIEWRNLALIGLCMFVLTYGPLFWAEQYVSSSITAVIEATLPITTITLEVLVFRTQSLRWHVLAGVALGFSGVGLLLLGNGSQHLAVIPCVVILGAGVAWSCGAVFSSRLTLPSSRPLTAGAEMMLGGAALLLVSATTGELHPFPHMTVHALLAVSYLIVFGSLIAYTAYVWLLGRFSATRVSSHAYVNPLVAVALGYFAADELVTARTLVASLLIVASVFLILAGGNTKKDHPGGPPAVPDHSLGTKIHSSTYNSRPAPAQINSTVNSNRHTQASIPVDRAIPPHTPPNHRSVRLRRNVFTADASGSLERVCSVFRRRSFARLNSSSVNPPFARSSASLLSSSASAMEHSLR